MSSAWYCVSFPVAALAGMEQHGLCPSGLIEMSGTLVREHVVSGVCNCTQP